MAGLRETKNRMKKALQGDDWQQNLPEIINGGLASVGPLFSFLLLDSQTRHRAAIALGKTINNVTQKNSEDGKNICRRFMWHMNEDSGNIGWGIPEAFAETLVENEELARTYAPILISYIMDLGHADNYCDQDVLRRSCYWAVGRLAQKWPQLAENARPWLIRGLKDNDGPCQGMAAWALAQLKPQLMDAPFLRKLAESTNQDECEFFDGDKIFLMPANEAARNAMKQI